MQEVQDYADGVVEPNPDTLSQSYVYRGIDEAAALMDDIGPGLRGPPPPPPPPRAPAPAPPGPPPGHVWRERDLTQRLVDGLQRV